ncbi:MAG: hypothetical protein DRP65_03735 [Planctomycetota bacterium]|nr:MAG: hypothetical protein DRP65_03735 [Planctomycetota bacterium]
MSMVFFGGSRRISRLSKAVRDRADNIVSNGHIILLGDANGADKAMQQYLAERKYRNVLVFCMGDMCRNNIGNWKTRNIHSDGSKKDFNYYSTKDLVMSDEADCGFMLWDGKSKGTLNNILNLCKHNKKVLVYFSPTKSFYTLRNFDDVSNLLKHCDQGSLQKFDKVIGIGKRISSQQQFSFV